MLHLWERRIRTMPGHKQRVGCTAWSHHMLATGSRDRSILLRDVRQQDPFTMKLAGHRSEVRCAGLGVLLSAWAHCAGKGCAAFCPVCHIIAVHLPWCVGSMVVGQARQRQLQLSVPAVASDADATR
jgi:hypothetical protein